MKLHLGCGPRIIPGFTHVDALNYEHVDHVSDVSDLDFLPDDAVEMIYACHVLEHFSRKEVPVVLREWNRVLAPGGLLRLSVPDLEQMLRIYEKHKDINLVLGPLVGGQKDEYDYHKIVFDRAYLSDLLTDAGFKDCRLWDWRLTEHSNVDDYSQAYVPHMQKETGDMVSLNLEAVKPTRN